MASVAVPFGGPFGCQLEDVDGVAGGGDAEEGGCSVEGHAVDVGWHRASTELEQLLGRGETEYPDDGAFVGSCGQESTGRVQCDT